MTDASLMDADCTHGRAWYDCPACDELMAAQLEAERRSDELVAAELRRDPDGMEDW